MKSFTRPFLIVALMVTAVVPASAQEEGETEYLRIPYNFRVSVEGGVGIPSRPETFNDLWNATLPATITVGYAVFPWLEVAGAFTYANYGVSEIPAKAAIGFEGTNAVEGGDLTVLVYQAFARIAPFTSVRANPFVDFGVGRFSTSTSDLVIVDTMRPPRKMEDASGIAVTGAFGIQYALNEYWDAFTRFRWAVGLDDTFNPEAIVHDPDDPDGPDAGAAGNLQFGVLSVGIAVRF